MKSRLGVQLGELIVPLEYDSVSESDGMITVFLNPVAEPVDYQLSQSDNSAIVQVKNLDIPVLSITVHEDSSPFTTESSSTPILFEITATIPFTTKTVFNFEITESADFLAPSENTKTFDTFPAGQSSYILPLRFDDDQIHEIHGTVSVTLTKDTTDPPQYLVNAHGEGRSATAHVKDDELPFLMVRPVSDAVIEGSPVEFELFTNSIRDESFMVNLSLSGNLNFLQALPSPT